MACQPIIDVRVSTLRRGHGGVRACGVLQALDIVIAATSRAGLKTGGKTAGASAGHPDRGGGRLRLPLAVGMAISCEHATGNPSQHGTARPLCTRYRGAPPLRAHLLWSRRVRGVMA